MAIKIDLQKLVNVNITHEEVSESVSTRDTYVIATDFVQVNTLLTSIPNDVVATYGELLAAKITYFFNNGGRKLLLTPTNVSLSSSYEETITTESGNTTGIEPAQGQTVTSQTEPTNITYETNEVSQTITTTFTMVIRTYTYGEETTSVSTRAYTQSINYGSIANVINNLDDKYIVVNAHFVTSTPIDIELYFKVNELVSNILDKNTGIHRKIVVTQRNAIYSDSGNLSLAIKVSSLYGSESTISAYLTQLDVYDSTSLNDYAYTTENGDFDNDLATISDSDISNVSNLKYNFDMKIAGYFRNVGGNLSTGSIGIVNEFTLIVLQQTLTDKLTSLLATKIKGQKGVGEIKSTMTEELEKYRLSGYLITDTIWDKADLVVNGNIVIAKNTPMNLGYYVYVFPFTSTSDRRSVSAFVILATEKGIRYINVVGKAY